MTYEATWCHTQAADSSQLCLEFHSTQSHQINGFLFLLLLYHKILIKFDNYQGISRRSLVGTTTLRITTFSITTHLSHRETQYNSTQHNDTKYIVLNAIYAECHK
jgi:hypothetical protein